MTWRGLARRSLPFLVTATAGFVLAYLLVAFVVFPRGIIPTDRAVPGVTGLAYDDAAKRLEAAGFKAAKGEQRYNANAPAGTVLGQSPVGGAVEPKGTAISLDLSLGQHSAEVPTLVGLTRQQAQHALEGVGLDEGQVTEQKSDQPLGQVLASDPAAGTKVPLPMAVNLVVSGGPATVQVPDVVGTTFEQARRLLTQLGLQVGTVTNDTLSTLPSNTVVSQTPAAGRAVPAGARIAVTVAGSERHP